MSYFRGRAELGVGSAERAARIGSATVEQLASQFLAEATTPNEKNYSAPLAGELRRVHPAWFRGMNAKKTRMAADRAKQCDAPTAENKFEQRAASLYLRGKPALRPGSRCCRSKGAARMVPLPRINERILLKLPAAFHCRLKRFHIIVHSSIAASLLLTTTTRNSIRSCGNGSPHFFA